MVFWISILGTAVSLIGFALTLYQLHKTKTATIEAAIATNLALAGVKSRVASYDATFELARAVSLIQETQRHIKTPSWESFITSYAGARDALIRLIELPSSIGSDDRKKLGNILTNINIVCANVNRGLLKNEVQIDRGRVLRLANEYEQTLSRISVSFQRGII